MAENVGDLVILKNWVSILKTRSIGSKIPLVLVFLRNCVNILKLGQMGKKNPTCPSFF